MNIPSENARSPQQIGKRRSLKSLGVLLVAALLAPLATAQADTWSFKLVHTPDALNSASPKGESIRLSGGGTFDPGLGMVAASGTFTISNGFDHPLGPIVHGTWHSTGFVSFTTLGKHKHDDDRRDGMLIITIETDDAVGGGVGTGILTVTVDGIQGPIYAGEPYIVPPGGSGGGARFHRDDDDDELFFPLPL